MPTITDIKDIASLPPIPFVPSPVNWGQIPIRDNDELLVPILGSDRLRSHSLYFSMRIPEASPTITVRAGVLVRLQAAVADLPKEVSLVVFDGYRPLAVQRWLWDTYLALLMAEEPNLSREHAERKVRQFVAFPEADPLHPPPHRTGGAVDVYLVETETGVELPMGTRPDEMAAESVTRHYEDVLQYPFTTHRRLLWHAMTAAGFANYPGEWWHYEYGNQHWAEMVGVEAAIYGLPGYGDVGL